MFSIVAPQLSQTGSRGASLAFDRGHEPLWGRGAAARDSHQSATPECHRKQLCGKVVGTGRRLAASSARAFTTGTNTQRLHRSGRKARSGFHTGRGNGRTSGGALCDRLWSYHTDNLHCWFDIGLQWPLPPCLAARGFQRHAAPGNPRCLGGCFKRAHRQERLPQDHVPHRCMEARGSRRGPTSRTPQRQRIGGWGTF